MGVYLVYGLVDPRTLLVRYVGKSESGLERPRSHRHKCIGSTHREHWIAELKRAGLSYEIAVLESVATQDALVDAERWWIAFGRACGWPLTNHTDGGEGASGREWTAAMRANASEVQIALKRKPGRWKFQRDAPARRSAAISAALIKNWKTRDRSRFVGEQNPARRSEVRARQREIQVARMRDPVARARILASLAQKDASISDESILALRGRGLSTADVARAFGRSYDFVYKRLRAIANH